MLQEHENGSFVRSLTNATNLYGIDVSRERVEKEAVRSKETGEGIERGENRVKFGAGAGEGGGAGGGRPRRRR